MIVTELDESFAEDAEAGTEPPTWAGDVEPWLGERASFWLTDLEADTVTGDTPASFVAEVTDTEAAGAALERLAASSGSEVEEKTAGDIEYLVSTGEEPGAGGVVGEHLVLATTEQDFLAALDVVEGESESLADSEEFEPGVGDVGVDEALAYAYLDSAALVDAAVAADPSAEVDGEQIRGFAAEAGFDLEQPVAFALTADEDSASFDASVAVEGEGPDLQTGSELLATLPGDAWLAGTCVGCLEGFKAGVDFGIEREAALDGVSPEEAQRAIRERLGVDTDELLGALGGVAYFARGTSVFDLGGAVVAEVEDRAVVEDAIEAARTVIEAEAWAAVALTDLPADLPVEATGFAVNVPGAPISVNVAVSDERLVVGFGEDSTAQAFSAEETLEASGATEPVLEAVGEDFEPATILDVDTLVEILSSVSSDPDLAAAEPYLEPLGAVYAGERVEDGRYVTRTVVGFD